jgi:carbamoyltransferase
MLTLGINTQHNASICLIEDNKIILYLEEERVSRYKKDPTIFSVLLRLKQFLKNRHIDCLAYAGTLQLDNPRDGNILEEKSLSIHSMLLKLKIIKDNIKYVSYCDYHHLTHAYTTFINSGFTDSYVIIVDGCGSTIQTNNPMINMTSRDREVETVYYFKKTNLDITYEILIKTAFVDAPTQEKDFSYNKLNLLQGNEIGVGWMFEAVCNHVGFEFDEAGKVMGMSAYGQPDAKIPNPFPFQEENIWKGNPNLFYSPKTGNDRSGINTYINPYLKNKSFEINSNLAYKVQQGSFLRIKSLIEDCAKMEYNCNNFALSGGYFLNCVNNYKTVSYFQDYNFYVEPVSHDGGTAIGAAYLASMEYSMMNSSPKMDFPPLSSLYLGPEPSYNIELEGDESLVDVSVDYVAELISKQNIVCLFQGRSEAGPRALGNRSILFDPRVKDGKDIVNVVKKREWFRPFAGSILEQHADEWFDLAGLKSSPFMMYAMQAKEKAKESFPSIVHVDGTCRIQTVNQKQNQHFYNLIESFYNITGVPIVLNTSFNLAGDALVETIDDALETMRRSEMKFLYLPEIGKLYIKNDN